jgi:uncharacterized protein with FMN-binding domain
MKSSNFIRLSEGLQEKNMFTKRFFLIAGGTVGGLGAVLSITPPQFGSTSGLSLGTGTSLSGGTTSLSGGTTTSTPAATPTPATTKKATSTKKATTTKKPVPATTKKATTSTPKSTPAPVSTPKPAGVSGTFTGASANTVYGPVQVQITVSNGKITNAIALVYPTGSFRDQEINQQAIPYLIQETLAAQSANIQGVGGASYTSQGWVGSLQSALAKAGL